jgi:two-component sensor histidine kinase
LKENTKSFTAYFTLLDYEDRQHRYAYKLEGFDKDWSYINDDHIQLGNLPYNNYTLKVRAQLDNGDWYGNEINIRISVVAPFYKQWWFITLIVLLLLVSVIFTIRIRTRVLKNKNTRLEEIVNNRTKELQVSLNEQKAMLQEIHHRVKNNLQFIEAIIAMQINISQEETNQVALMDINRRINAMTLVHEMLYNKDSLETISVKEYIHELTGKLSGMVNSETAPVKFDIHVEDVYFNINNCLAVGMITTELASNSLKHAFLKTADPRIGIHLTMNTATRTIVYTFEDNGPGINENHVRGLGMRLIDIFARQLRGTYSLSNQHGLLFTFEFSLREK